MQWQSYRIISGLLFLASVIGMAFALYLEHVQGLDPCPLCVFQRIGLIGLGFISLIALLHHPKTNAFKRFYAFLGLVSNSDNQFSKSFWSPCADKLSISKIFAETG